MVITVNKLERNVMEKLAVTLLEGRYFEDTAEICKKHLNMLPEGTDMILYTDLAHKEKYETDFKAQKIDVIIKEYDQNFPVPIEIKFISGMEKMIADERMKNILNYCLVTTSEKFWLELFHYDRTLMIHRDTMVLRKGIEEFYQYDYIGAPCYNYIKDQTIQNSGFSLRNPKVMEYISRVYGWKRDIQDMMVVGQYSSAWFFAEDIFFCLRLIKHKAGTLAPLEAAKRFSCEVKYELGTLGYHAIERYMTEDEVKRINEQYNY
jgi:hypothetical protein